MPGFPYDVLSSSRHRYFSKLEPTDLYRFDSIRSALHTKFFVYRNLVFLQCFENPITDRLFWEIEVNSSFTTSLTSNGSHPTFGLLLHVEELVCAPGRCFDRLALVIDGVFLL